MMRWPVGQAGRGGNGEQGREGHAVVVDVGALRGLRKEETDGEAAGRGGAARG
jgi:hypothetical protein